MCYVAVGGAIQFHIKSSAKPGKLLVNILLYLSCIQMIFVGRARPSRFQFLLSFRELSMIYEYEEMGKRTCAGACQLGLLACTRTSFEALYWLMALCCAARSILLTQKNMLSVSILALPHSDRHVCICFGALYGVIVLCCGVLAVMQCQVQYRRFSTTC